MPHDLERQIIAARAALSDALTDYPPDVAYQALRSAYTDAMIAQADRRIVEFREQVAQFKRDGDEPAAF